MRTPQSYDDRTQVLLTAVALWVATAVIGLLTAWPAW
jgi:hypothetical protein